MSAQGYMRPTGYKGLAGFHKYWGKKPVEAWRFLIDHFTAENDILLDPFLGSGLVARECTDRKRRFVGFDVNPISIELTRLFVDLPDHAELVDALNGLTEKVRDAVLLLYSLADGRVVSHLLWNGATIEKAWVKSANKRREVALTDDDTCRFERADNYLPNHVRNIQLFDNSRINSKACFSLNDLFSSRAIRSIDLLKDSIGIYDGNVRRALTLILSSSLGQMSNMVFAVSNRQKTRGQPPAGRIEVGSWVVGYWRPERHFEVNPWNCFENKARKLLKAIEEFANEPGRYEVASSFDVFQAKKMNIYIALGDSENLLDEVPRGTVKLILTDPPHGDRIPYLELSEMWNSVLGLDVNYDDELVVSDAKERRKGTVEYNNKLSSILEKCEKALCHGGLMAVMFNARAKNHWDGLRKLDQHSTLSYIGCYPMEYSVGSVSQDNRRGGLKKDYVLLYGKGEKASYGQRISSVLHDIPGWAFKHPTVN